MLLLDAGSSPHPQGRQGAKTEAGCSSSSAVTAWLSHHELAAARPEAFELLMSLKNQPWSMHYKAGDFRTEVKGSRFTVNRVKVYFDSRSAAVFASHAACDEDVWKRMRHTGTH